MTATTPGRAGSPEGPARRPADAAPSLPAHGVTPAKVGARPEMHPVLGACVTPTLIPSPQGGGRRRASGSVASRRSRSRLPPPCGEGSRVGAVTRSGAGCTPRHLRNDPRLLRYGNATPDLSPHPPTHSTLPPFPIGRRRARNGWRGTSRDKKSLRWSDFPEKALRAALERREPSEPSGGGLVRLTPGRPAQAPLQPCSREAWWGHASWRASIQLHPGQDRRGDGRQNLRTTRVAKPAPVPPISSKPRGRMAAGRFACILEFHLTE